MYQNHSTSTVRGNKCIAFIIVWFNNVIYSVISKAAVYWNKYVQPGAEAYDLNQVSLTLNAKPNAIAWFSDFLPEYPALGNCAVNLIKKFAIHQYICRESIWNDWYGDDQSSLLIYEPKVNLGKSWGNYLETHPL